MPVRKYAQSLDVPHTLQPVSEDHAPSTCFTNPHRAIVRGYNNTTEVFRYDVTTSIAFTQL